MNERMNGIKGQKDRESPGGEVATPPSTPPTGMSSVPELLHVNLLPRVGRKQKKAFPSVLSEPGGPFQKSLYFRTQRKGLQLSFILLQLGPAHGAKGLGPPSSASPPNTHLAVDKAV